MSPGRGLPRLQAGALRALAVGHSTLDRYGDDLLPGGSAWYGARVFAALGADVSLHTAHGQGGDSNAFDGLAVTRTPSEHWTVFTNRHDSQGRRTQHVETEASPIPPPASPPRPTPDVLFLAPVFGELSLSAWVEAVPARQSLDQRPAAAVGIAVNLPRRRLVGFDRRSLRRGGDGI